MYTKAWFCFSSRFIFRVKWVSSSFQFCESRLDRNGLIHYPVFLYQIVSLIPVFGRNFQCPIKIKRLLLFLIVRIRVECKPLHLRFVFVFCFSLHNKLNKKNFFFNGLSTKMYFFFVQICSNALTTLLLNSLCVVFYGMFKGLRSEQRKDI